MPFVFCRALLEGESKPWIIWREELAGKLPQGKIQIFKKSF